MNASSLTDEPPRLGVGAAVAVGAGACLLGALCFWAMWVRSGPIESYEGVIQGVKICIPETPVVPADFQVPDCRATRLHPALRERALSEVDAVLRKYPEYVLSTCLDTVTLIGHLEYSGFTPQGAYWENTIFAGADHLSEVKDRAEFRRTVHHEISSLLLVHFRDIFPEEDWLQANPEGFAYSLGQRPLTADDNTAMTEEDAMDGFACKYGRYDSENDYNTVVENLCEPSGEFIGYLRKSPRLRTKALLVVEFYRKITPELTSLFPRETLEALGLATLIATK